MELIWVAGVMVGGTVEAFQIIRRQLGLYRGAEMELALIEELLGWGWMSGEKFAELLRNRFTFFDFTCIYGSLY